MENSTQTPTAPPPSDTLNSQFSKRSNRLLPDSSVPSSSSSETAIIGECSDASAISQDTKDSQQDIAASNSSISPPTPPER